MNTKTATPVNILLIVLLGTVLAIPIAAEAGRGHHRFGHTHHHYYNHGGHAHHHHHHRHYKKRHYKRHHYRRHNPYYGGYNRIYSPPRHYYNRPNYNRPYYNKPYRRYYNQHYYNPQPVYSYASQVISSPPVAGYSYPPQVMLGVNTGKTSFMLRY